MIEILVHTNTIARVAVDHWINTLLTNFSALGTSTTEPMSPKLLIYSHEKSSLKKDVMKIEMVADQLH